jgi:hypothetical protein
MAAKGFTRSRSWRTGGDVNEEAAVAVTMFFEVSPREGGGADSGVDRLGWRPMDAVISRWGFLLQYLQ